jgi:hypothetical protein
MSATAGFQPVVNMTAAFSCGFKPEAYNMQYHEIRYANLAAAKIEKIKDMSLRAIAWQPHHVLTNTWFIICPGEIASSFLLAMTYSIMYK